MFTCCHFYDPIKYSAWRAPRAINFTTRHVLATRGSVCIRQLDPPVGGRRRLTGTGIPCAFKLCKIKDFIDPLPTKAGDNKGG